QEEAEPDEAGQAPGCGDPAAAAATPAPTPVTERLLDRRRALLEQGLGFLDLLEVHPRGLLALRLGRLRTGGAWHPPPSTSCGSSRPPCRATRDSARRAPSPACARRPQSDAA